MPFLSLRNFVVTVVFLLCFAVICPPPASAKTNPGTFITARAAFLMDADTGVILYEKNAHLRLPPASTTKVMTAIVALEQGNQDARLCASWRASQVQPCKVAVRSGERWEMDDLLRCILLNSANDASVVIAEGVAGSVANFADVMNRTAQKIGATKTHFANPHGLDQANHYSTAHDLVLIYQYAAKKPTFRKIIQTKSMSIRGPNQRLILLRNHNKLLGNFDGMVGGKTGYTRRAKKCFVGEAQRNGTNLLVCVLGSQDHFKDVARLLDYGFSLSGKDGRQKAKNRDANETLFAGTLPPNPRGNYVLQVASFADPNNALGLNQTLSDNGYPSFIEKTTLKNGVIHHRVKVGYYQDLTSAKKTKECIGKYFGLNSLILYREAHAFP